MGGKRWTIPLTPRSVVLKLTNLPTAWDSCALQCPTLDFWSLGHTCLGPLTLLELWQLFHSNHEEESLETIMTIQLSLPSSTLPMILPTEGLRQSNAGIWVSGSASFLLPENFLPYRTPSHKPWRRHNSKQSVVSSFEGLWRWNSFQISYYIP